MDDAATDVSLVSHLAFVAAAFCLRNGPSDLHLGGTGAAWSGATTTVICWNIASAGFL